MTRSKSCKFRLIFYLQIAKRSDLAILTSSGYSFATRLIDIISSHGISKATIQKDFYNIVVKVVDSIEVVDVKKVRTLKKARTRTIKYLRQGRYHLSQQGDQLPITD